MIEDQCFDFSAFTGPEPKDEAVDESGPRIIGIGQDLVAKEDARALQARLAAGLMGRHAESGEPPGDDQA